MNRTNHTPSQRDAKERWPAGAAPRRCAEHQPVTRPPGAVNLSAASPGTLRLLQRRAGNHRASPWIHTKLSLSKLSLSKLTVGPADDPYEREAERMAAQVAGASSAAPAPDRSSPPPVQTAASTSSAQQPEVGPQGGEVSDQIERALAGSKGSGAPLPAPTRASMEQHFGADFSGVRVHTGAQAGALNQQLGALAFTHGADIYISEGRYNPASSDGQRLLAHELTHVVQQGAARSAAAQRLSRTSRACLPCSDSPSSACLAGDRNWSARADGR